MYARILIGVFAILTIAASFVYHLAASVNSDRQTFEDQARQWTTDRTTITQIDSIEEFRGTKSYTVVIGKNKVGTPVIAWMTADKLTFDTMDGVYPKQRIEDQIKKENANAKNVHITPGLDGEKRFWEAVFLDQEKRYNYVYFDFKTGKSLKSYKLSPAQS